MASEAGNSSSSQKDQSLFNLFDEAMNLFETIENDNEPTNSTSVQLLIKTAMSKFEAATQLVSLSGMFSRNEHVREIPTEHLRFLLLPALLGSLCLKICNQPRKEIIDTAEIYFRDYLQRCKDYEITEIEMPHSSDQETNAIAIRNQSEQNKIAAMVHTREAKIKRYKDMKELKVKLLKLKKDLDSPHLIDDEIKREYQMTLLINYVNQALEELSSIEQEKPILEYMAQHAGENKPYKPENKHRTPHKPLKPFIITKDAAQKAVFGMGYPSLPSISIEEFYDQRVKEGTFPAGCAYNIPHQTITQPEEDADETEQIRKERLIEEEDPEEVERQRNMDEYKDDHRRGWGNRYNRS